MRNTLLCSGLGTLVGMTAVRWLPRRRWFWIGLGGVMAFHLINGLYEWFPNYAIQIPRYFEFREILAAFELGGADGQRLAQRRALLTGLGYLQRRRHAQSMHAIHLAHRA